MEQTKSPFRMLEFAMSKQEVSCLIGNLFVEIEPPCYHNCKNEEIRLYGTTYLGTKELLIITEFGFIYSGKPEDIERIRGRRCLIEFKE